MDLFFFLLGMPKFSQRVKNTEKEFGGDFEQT